MNKYRKLLSQILSMVLLLFGFLQSVIADDQESVLISGDPSYHMHTNYMHVFARDLNGHLREWWGNDEIGWNLQNLTNVVGGQTIASNPVSYNDNGTQHVFARDSNGHLREWWWTAELGWHLEDLTEKVGGTTIVGDPFYYNEKIYDYSTTPYKSKTRQHVFARGSNGHLLQWWWTAELGWNLEDLTNVVGGQTIAGNPVSIYVNDTLHVFARDSNGHLREWWWTEKLGWHLEDLTHMVGENHTIASDPDVSFFVHDYDTFVGEYVLVAQGTNGHLLEWKWNSKSNHWTINDLTAAVGGQTIAGKPAYNTISLNRYRKKNYNIFARDSNGHLLQWWWLNETGWNVTNLTTGVVGGKIISGNPISIHQQRVFDTDKNIFVRDYKGRLLHWSWSNSTWQVTELKTVKACEGMNECLCKEFRGYAYNKCQTERLKGSWNFTIVQKDHRVGSSVAPLFESVTYIINFNEIKESNTAQGQYEISGTDANGRSFIGTYKPVAAKNPFIIYYDYLIIPLHFSNENSLSGCRFSSYYWNDPLYLNGILSWEQCTYGYSATGIRQ